MKLSLESCAIGIFLDCPELSKEQIAALLRVHPSSVARLPTFSRIFAAHRECNRGAILRGRATRGGGFDVEYDDPHFDLVDEKLSE
ncbi:MAG TPA: hypothetical protein VH253_10945 [Phycisphaerae bacterium]|nr:hypothetical protein [Phycisphaerae bacterium]